MTDNRVELANIYVLIDAKTGKFWQKQSTDNRRGVYAFKSKAKAEATLKQFRKGPEKGEVVVQMYLAPTFFKTNETKTDSTRGSDR